MRGALFARAAIDEHEGACENMHQTRPERSQQFRLSLEAVSARSGEQRFPLAYSGRQSVCQSQQREANERTAATQFRRFFGSLAPVSRLAAETARLA